MSDRPDVGSLRAVQLVDRLRQTSTTLAVAESVTGGLVLARLTDVPGVSVVLRGGVVAYATDAKTAQLGVDRELLADHGPVHADVAVAMARGVRTRWGADLGLATTGVAGPDPQGGRAVGEVYLAVSGPREDQVQHLVVPHVGTGDRREQVRAAAVDAALALLWRALDP